MSSNQRRDTPGEEEPLLGLSQNETDSSPATSVLWNLITGTSIIAQLGGFALVGTIYYIVLTHDVIFMSAHPLLNSVGILLVLEAILVVQPATQGKEKTAGAYAHSVFNNVGVSALIAGAVIIEINKGRAARFESLHAKLGLATYIWILLQAWFGIAMFFAPGLFGGVDAAKATYKYHRISGYLLLTLLLSAASSAALTTYVKTNLGLASWPLAVASGFVLLGVLPRVNKQKLGF